MMNILAIFILVLVTILLVWFGSHLSFRLSLEKKMRDPALKAREGSPGAPKTCPVCSIKLLKGERVSSSVFPSMNGNDRIMHIKGCPYCLNPEKNRTRRCPVCNKTLPTSAYLVARMYEKPGRSHVHVSGCSFCRKN